MIRLIGQDEDTVDLDAGRAPDPRAELLGAAIFVGSFALLGTMGWLGIALVLWAPWRVAFGWGLLGFVVSILWGMAAWVREHQ
jgi:hypothetical protein